LEYFSTSQMNEQQDIFRNFIKREHLSSKWEEYLKYIKHNLHKQSDQEFD